MSPTRPGSDRPLQTSTADTIEANSSDQPASSVSVPTRHGGARAWRVIWRRRLRQIMWALLFLSISLGGAVLSVGTLGRTVYRWHGFAVELRLLPSVRGETALVLMPLGEVQAHTHRAPVKLVATLQEIEIEEINKVLRSSPRMDAITLDFENTARASLRDFIMRQLAVAALGALLGPILLRSRRPWKYFVASLLGVTVVGITLGSALTSFSGKAFESPTYTGALKHAPWVIQFGKDAFVRIEELSQKLRTVAANLNVLYGRIESPPDHLGAGSDGDSIRILHVSDLHNNPAGLSFMQEVARQFHVSMIVDTGDLTDFGSPPETAMVQGIAKIGYPYVFVAGNHDSQAVIGALQRLPNVTVLNGQVTTVQGFTLLGLPNPASARASVGSVETTPEELQAGGDLMLRLVQGLREPPDIVAIHNPEESRPLWGRTPLVLCGHLHRYYVDVESGLEVPWPEPSIGPTATAPPPAGIAPRIDTVVCNAGTTGAAGLRYFEREQGVPFSCAVLTFRAIHPSPTDTATAARSPESAVPTMEAGDPRPRLASIDLIVLDGALHQYSITHRPFSERPNASLFGR